MPDVTPEQAETLARWVTPTVERLAALRTRMRAKGFTEEHPLMVRVIIAHEAVAALSEELQAQRPPKRFPPHKPHVPADESPQWLKAMQGEDTSPY